MNPEDHVDPVPGNVRLPRVSYKIAEAAKILGVSQATIRRAIERGLLKPCRAFRHPLIPAEQLRQLVNS
jgi:excisionase family DNA binding protein